MTKKAGGGKRKKLVLNRKTIVRLTEKHLGQVAGGACIVESAAPTDVCEPPPEPPPPPPPPGGGGTHACNTSKLHQTGANHNQALRHR